MNPSKEKTKTHLRKKETKNQKKEREKKNDNKKKALKNKEKQFRCFLRLLNLHVDSFPYEP